MPKQVILIHHKLSYTLFPLACPVARTCKEWLDAGINKSGIYPVDPDGQGTFQVCITTALVSMQ